MDLSNVGISPFYMPWRLQMAVLEAESHEVVDLIETDVDVRKLGPGTSLTVRGSGGTKLDPSQRYQLGLRILQPGAAATKEQAWKLSARNTYVVLANDVKVQKGAWDGKHALQGGWNILGDVQQTQPAASQRVDTEGFRPLEGHPGR